MALGANRRGIFGLILARGAWLAGIGVVLGLAVAVGVTRLINSLLYDTSAMDPFTFVGVIALLLVVGLLASYIPARRAMRVDPIVALRHE